MWAALSNTNPATFSSSSSSSSSSGAASLFASAPVQTFKFNFSAPDDGDAEAENMRMNDSEEANATQSGGADADAASTAPRVFARPAVQHFLKDAVEPLTIDQVETITLQPSSTFTVTPLLSSSAPSANQLAAFSSHTSLASTPLIQFLKRHSAPTHGTLKQVLADSDLITQVYEGGFKVWECAIDLILFMQKQLSPLPFPASSSSSSSSSVPRLFPASGMKGLRVADLGCGHGFPALYALQQGASYVALQDYNHEVITSVCFDAVRLNLTDPRQLEQVAIAAAAAQKQQQEFQKKHNVSGTSNDMDDTDDSASLTSGAMALPAIGADREKAVGFFSGDWSDPALLQIMGGRGSYDLILTSDTLYSSAYMNPLFDLITALLSERGIALVAAKRYYFGIGGSTMEFTNLVQSRGKGLWQVDVVDTIEDGKSNIREILCVRKKQS